MRSPLLILTGTLVALSSFGFRTSDYGFGAGEAEDRARAFAKLERGMSPEQVRQRVGAPSGSPGRYSITAISNSGSTILPMPRRLQFDCPRGQTPQLLWKQVLAVEKDERRAGPANAPIDPPCPALQPPSVGTEHKRRFRRGIRRTNSPALFRRIIRPIPRKDSRLPEERPLNRLFVGYTCIARSLKLRVRLDGPPPDALRLTVNPAAKCSIMDQRRRGARGHQP